ncbi:MAG: tyrosine-type recombinase/integrase [Cyanothece sp. SIO1E1]|nr:tyrosine-type recombinase/integrase [Cyanothece sp. SIO1E1]
MRTLVHDRHLLKIDAEASLVRADDVSGRLLTAEQFHRLRDVPTVIEWLGNIENEKTCVAYKRDVGEFCRFVGITDASAEQFRLVTRAHVIAWREALKSGDRKPKPCSDSTVRRKLAALSAFFKYLCDHHSINENPVSGVKRPKSSASEGSTPAASDDQIRALLAAPSEETLKGKRDRAILSTLAYHGLRREELCALRVRDYSLRAGVMQFMVHGKGNKIRYLPVHPGTQELIHIYLEASGHGGDLDGALFRPIQNNSTDVGVAKGLSPALSRLFQFCLIFSIASARDDF